MVENNSEDNKTFDYYKKMIESALGMEPNFDLLLEQPQPNAEKLIISDKTGIIKDIKLPQVGGNIIDVSMDYKIGDKVNKFKKGPDRIGQVIVTEESLEKAEKLLEDVMNQIEIIIE